MPITVVNKNVSSSILESLHPGAFVVDVTTHAKGKFLPLCPLYPHGGIPVPFSESYYSKSVEGIWEGLKVFKDHDVDISKFEIDSMRGFKRTARRFGIPLGHREGVMGDFLLRYPDARMKIYIPSYEWVLKHKAESLIQELADLSREQHVVLLDYRTNGDIFDRSSFRLSHAVLIKQFIEGNFSFQTTAGV
jgi:hypothetical protein